MRLKVFWEANNLGEKKEKNLKFKSDWGENFSQGLFYISVRPVQIRSFEFMDYTISKTPSFGKFLFPIK